MVEFDENPYLAARAILQKRISRIAAYPKLLRVGLFRQEHAGRCQQVSAPAWLKSLNSKCLW